MIRAPVFVVAALAAAAAAQAAPDIAVSIGGEIAPGVYGRVDMSNRPPPPLVYPQPVLIVKPPPTVVVAPEPVYMHVPPGHARNWRKHCRKYHACDRPVYFVKSAEYERGYRKKPHGKKDD
jgi:hypothetical protein